MPDEDEHSTNAGDRNPPQGGKPATEPATARKPKDLGTRPQHTKRSQGPQGNKRG